LVDGTGTADCRLRAFQGLRGFFIFLFAKEGLDEERVQKKIKLFPYRMGKS